MLSYNGSSWLNTATTSLYMAGNRVNVKFSSKGSGLSVLTGSIYKPIFGDDIRFTREGGKEFMKRSLEDPGVSAVVAFGSATPAGSGRRWTERSGSSKGRSSSASRHRFRGPVIDLTSFNSLLPGRRRNADNSCVGRENLKNRVD